MPKLFLVPIINLFDVHDVAVRDWLNRLDEVALQDHLEYPFKLERFFPESTRRAIAGANAVHDEILRLLDIIDPQAIFLDISTDFVEIENKYNNRSISPLEFWSLYFQTSAEMNSSSKALYCIYIKGIIDKNVKLIESREHLPLSVVFYGTDIKTREELIPAYDNILEKDGEFLLQIARVVNDITMLRETPKNLWYSPMDIRQMAISYEETEKFYTELLIRLRRMLRFKVRDHIVKSLRDKAFTYTSSYEGFLDQKMREDEIKFMNIMEGIDILTSQSDFSSLIILCGPFNYISLLTRLKNEKTLLELGIVMEDLNIDSLLDKMRPFTQKNRIMQSNYDIALDILDLKKPEKYASDKAILVPQKS